MDQIGEYLPALLPFILVGFAAQLIDGALGMAYGVISSTLLLAMGLPPKAASAGTHAAETVTTAVSGLSHIWHRNVDWRLFARLAVPGIAGGVTGAYLLSNVDSSAVKPYVLSYLTTIGLWLIWRSTHVIKRNGNPKIVGPLGFFGGFLDASGGGGWGPVVTSNLLLQGSDPRMTIGTVNTVEFLLTLSISITFLIHLGWEAFTAATLGLLIGGVIAAPFGALLAKRVAANHLLLMVGIVLTATSLYGIARSLDLIG
ncbi:MAG: sulfite exporter TauE/SafE family protein [Sphingomonadales bacterium]|nr:MAG: sulfite exporter TauE/SafE family protein [Sphingomonadales bacterium]TNF03856.1 MAG: sulfite exporter TauE/SafE family protein [Sphingomonadales bacterium]